MEVHFLYNELVIKTSYGEEITFLKFYLVKRELKILNEDDKKLVYKNVSSSILESIKE